MAADAEHEFFPVSVTKFLMLSICTLDIYVLYWCYKNWQRIQRRTSTPLSPFWRAFFSIFWCFNLFRIVRDDATKAGEQVTWNPTVLGGLYLVLSLTWRLPGGVGLISLLGCLAFVPVVQTIGAVNGRRIAEEGLNEGLTFANVVTIVVGGILLLLALVGAVMPAGVE